MSDRFLIAGLPSSSKHPDGVASNFERVGNQLDRIVSPLHGELWELASRGMLFHAASQAATTTTVALAATYTGLCLSNPAGSAVILEPRILSCGLSVAPAGIATIALGGGMTAAGVVTHTTPLVTYNNKLGNAAAAVGLVDAACTLPAGMRVIMPLENGFTAGALYGGRNMFNLGGGICIPAGGYVFVYTLTVAVGFFGIWWAEYPA